MDFMRVIDQTIREIKREVNLKVFKVPEIEQKVLDATNDEAWGPHGTALSEIAQASKRITDCQLIMGVLWMRLTDTGPNWRQVYKALTVIEYLISHGSERALDDIIFHISRITALSEFLYVEPNGKDSGNNVRKKVENLLVLLNDREKIRAAREKAAATRDKYFGLSSTGITSQASSFSYSSSGGSSSDHYGSLDDPRGGYSIQKYEINDLEHTRAVVEDALRTLQRQVAPPEHKDYLRKNSIAVLNQPDTIPSPKIHNAETNGEDDDFDPRRSSSGTADARNKQISLIGDLLDEAPPSTNSTADVNSTANTEIDLFADAFFQSASDAEKAPDSHCQGNIDLFENQLAFPTTPCPSDSALLAITDTGLHSEIKPAVMENAGAFDPFAEILLNFDKSKPSESFASHAEPVTTKTPEKPTNNNRDDESFSGSFSSPTQQTSSRTSHHSSPSSPNNPKSTSKSAAGKENFHVKSGIWADCFNRGLIDVNISSPKKVNLSDIGILGELEDVRPMEKEKGLQTASQMGKAMGAGSGLGMSGLSTTIEGSGNTSSFGQQFLK